MQPFVKLLFLLLACGTMGYFAEPLVFTHQDSSMREESLEKQPQTTGVLRDVRGEKAALAAKLKAEAEARALREKQEADRKAAEARAKELARLAAQKDHQKDDTPEVKRDPFPVKNISWDRLDKRSVIGSPELEKAIRYAIDHRRFDDLVALLEKELYRPVSKEKEVDPRELKKLLENPVWCHALNVYSMIQLFSYEEIGLLASASPSAGEFYFGILTSPEALTQFLNNVTPRDDVGKAMIIWQDIWENEKDGEIREKYLNLAIACALVFDSGNIQPKNDTSEIRPFERYFLFRSNAEKHRLKTTLSNMEVADLVWVVDVPLTDAEIEWALRRANFSRRRWGKAYGHIEYLMERAVNGENPYDGYTLAQIEKHGGICGDQTYFSVNTAKANGIPAAGVAGSGDRGGHAWLAYKPNKDEWDTNTGRYENYSNGTVKNPQTNQKMPEFDLLLMSDRKMKSTRIKEARILLRFVSVLQVMNHDRLGIRQTLDEVLDIAPLLPLAWTTYVDFLEKKDPELTQKEWQKIIDTMERTFKKHPSMWLTARALTKKHIWKYLDDDEIEKTQARYRSEIARKFPDRSDLIRDLVKDQAAMVNEKNDFKKTRSFFRQTLRLFGEDTLNFKFIADLYFKSGQKFPGERERICDDIENYFSRHLDKESGDFFKAKTEIGLLNKISRYYAMIGNDRKAAKYKKEADRRKIKSSRRAL
jgi:hypothetical protein